MKREGRQVKGRGEYVLSTDMQRFLNAGLMEARLYTDHRMVLTVIQGEGVLRNRRYVGGRTQWKLAPSTVRPQKEEEAASKNLKGEVEMTRRPKEAIEAWISQATWKLADRSKAINREGRANERVV